MVYTVGEMAKLLDVAPSTLRYYDKEGLLPFVERSSNGIRVFKDKDYEWLKVIGCLKKSGLSLKDIKDYIYMALEGDQSIEDRLALFEKQRERVKQQMAELQETLDMVEYKCWFYEFAKAAGTTDFNQTLFQEQLPEKHKQTLSKMRLKDGITHKTAKAIEKDVIGKEKHKIKAS